MRFITMFIFVLGISLMITSVAILPSYLLSNVRKNLANEKLNTEKNLPEPEVNPKILSIVKDLNEKLVLIENAQSNKYIVSEKVINEIILKKMPDIKINGISYTSDPVIGKSISISGIAPSRERLLLFSRILSDDVAFKKVDLPISNFIKGSDISFNLKLTPS